MTVEKRLTDLEALVKRALGLGARIEKRTVGHTIRENGTAQSQRPYLNFVDADAGTGLITDDAANAETEINLGLYLLESAALTDYLRLDGTNAMAADLNMDGNALVLSAGETIRYVADTITLQVEGSDVFNFGTEGQKYTVVNDFVQPTFYFRRALSGPAAVPTSSYLGDITFEGYDGVAYSTGARIQARSTQTFANGGGGAWGTALDFVVAANSAGAPRAVLTLDQSGQARFPITGSGAGILLGGDVQLYRSAANVLTIPDAAAITTSVTTPIVIGGTATGNPLTLRTNTLDDGYYHITVPTPTEGGAGDPDDESVRIVSAAGRRLVSFRFVDDTGGTSDTSTGLWMYPPQDGGRVRLDGFMNADTVSGSTALFQIHSHGMRETTHLSSAPRQHFSAYTYVDTWTERTTITELIAAGTPGDSVAFDVASTTGLAVNDEILIFAAAKTPGTHAPDGTWEYLRITAINALELTCTRGIGGHPAPAHASGEKVWEVTHDTSDKKWLEFGFGPCSDARTAGNVRLAFSHADVDLMGNKLLLNGAGGTMGGGTVWWEYSANRWTLTGVGGEGAELLISRDTSTDNVLFGYVAGAAAAHFAIRVDGALSWGPGTGATDVSLLRGAAGRLDTGGRITISNTGALSLGTTDAPPQAAEIEYVTPRSGQTHVALRIQGVGASAFADGGLYLGAARGTLGTPTTSVSGDRMGIIEFYAHDGDEYHRPSAIQAVVDGTVANNVVPSRIEFQTSVDTVTNRARRMFIDRLGNVVMNNTAALATSATDGFLHISTMAGAPSGTPTEYAGRAPVVFDTTNNRLYIRDPVADTWHYIAVTA